jgi:hypothetical protein
VEAGLVRATASKVDRDRLREHFASLFVWHPMPDGASRFIDRVQDELVDRGLHKRPRSSTSVSLQRPTPGV